MTAYRAKQPVATVNVIVKKNVDPDKNAIEAAVCLRAGIPEDALLKAYGEQTLESAYPDRDMSISGMMRECMRIDGMDVPRRFDNETIKAAFSTVSLPGILSNVANKKLLQSYEAQPVIATKLCATGDPPDRCRRPSAGRARRRDQGRSHRRRGGEEPDRHLRQEVLPDAQDDH